MKSIGIQVAAGSPAWRAGLRSGMRLLTMNGEPVLDFIDYEYFSAQRRIRCRMEGDEREYLIRKQAYEPLGMELETELYPPERRCANRCIFCFEDQLPPGVRDSLHAKDDDWRYSLLFGNYVTLTNMKEADFARLIARRVSPIYVSVHATDPEVRVDMMANPRAGAIMEQLTRLKEGGITFHAQVVLCPGINDGDVLERTIHDLWSLYPAAQSVAVVPLGMTHFRQGLRELTPVDAACACRVIRQVEAFSRWTRQAHGLDFAYASDEMYQIAHMDWPRYDAGGHQPQIANGVGLFHDLLADFDAALADAPARLAVPRQITLATGYSAYETLKDMMARLSAHTKGFSARVVRIRNDFFGDTITVAGLLTGGDLARQLEGLPLGDALLIPGSSLKDGDTLFLDDTTLEQLAQRLRVPVIPVPDDGYRLVELALGIKEEAWE